MEMKVCEMEGVVTSDLTWFTSEENPVCYFYFLPIKEGKVAGTLITVCKGGLVESLLEKVKSGTSIKIECTVENFKFRSGNEVHSTSGLALISFEIIQERELLHEFLS